MMHCYELYTTHTLLPLSILTPRPDMAQAHTVRYVVVAELSHLAAYAPLMSDPFTCGQLASVDYVKDTVSHSLSSQC